MLVQIGLFSRCLVPHAGLLLTYHEFSSVHPAGWVRGTLVALPHRCWSHDTCTTMSTTFFDAHTRMKLFDPIKPATLRGSLLVRIFSRVDFFLLKHPFCKRITSDLGIS